MSRLNRLVRIPILITAFTALVMLAMPALAMADDLPSRFDLRDRGVVTPVKQQNPWGSCWAFSATAATETSILSKLGTTYADTGFDLSERYLSWYVARPVTENINASQAGEGLNIYNVDAGPNHIHNFGGREMCAATLYAQGIGPQPESDYPYQGVNGQLAYDDLLADKDAYIALDMAALREFDQFSSDEAIRQYAEADYEYDLARYQKYDVYSPLDDWSIGDADEPGSGKLIGSSYTLTDNNVINYWVRKGTGDMDGNERYEQEGNQPIATWESSNLYQGSIDQIKSELYSGRGVSVDFSIDDNVINGDTWAIYNDHSLRVSRHAVCIVGWDDDYAASNFTHTRTPSGEAMIDSSGREISDEKATEITTPVGNGAWICKNSWGSETDMIPGGLVSPNGETKNANESAWGIVDENGQHTGYFYLSYYDYTIGVPESFDFDIVENHDQENALQLDYLPASAAEWRNTTTAPSWEANVFTLDKDMRIDAVGTRIRMTDMAPITGYDVTFGLYKLNEGAKKPDDGTHLATLTKSFESEGYHRAALDAPVYLKAGDRLGIVVQQAHTFGDGVTKYCVSAQETIGYRENPRWRRDPLWGNPVVNEGESFWKADGITDQEEGNADGWLDMTSPLTSALNQYLNPETWYLYENGYLGMPLWDFFNMDNFCIKAFGEPCSLEHVEAADPTCEGTGVIEHWRDPLTGATYADENGIKALAETSVAAIGHDWGEGAVTREPTTTAEGIRTFTCSRCGAERTEPIPPVPAKDATLRFELGGGSLNGSKDAFVMKVKVGDTVKAPNAPTRAGCTFVCWQTPELHPGDKYTVTGDYTFTAVWKKVDDEKEQEKSGKKKSDSGSGSNSSSKSNSKSGGQLTKSSGSTTTNGKESARGSDGKTASNASLKKTGDPTPYATIASLAASGMATIAMGLAARRLRKKL